MLSSRQGSIGPSDGLGGLVSAFKDKGLGDMIGSWMTPHGKVPSTSSLEDTLGSLLGGLGR
jgi:uncharacterized protein YidB (DUF937 family)